MDYFTLHLLKYLETAARKRARGNSGNAYYLEKF